MLKALHEKTTLPFDVSEDGETSTPVSPREITISENAQITIGLAAKEIAAHLGIPEHEIKGQLFGEMHWLEPSGRLMVILRTEEADMFVEIPEEHWEFKDKSKYSQ